MSNMEYLRWLLLVTWVLAYATGERHKRSKQHELPPSWDGFHVFEGEEQSEFPAKKSTKEPSNEKNKLGSTKTPEILPTSSRHQQKENIYPFSPIEDYQPGKDLTQSCTDYDGKTVPGGEIFKTKSDPCEQCLCDNGYPVQCVSHHCEPPHCEEFHMEKNQCCKFTCLTPDMYSKNESNSENYIPGAKNKEDVIEQPGPQNRPREQDHLTTPANSSNLGESCKTETDCRCPGKAMCDVSDFVSVWLTHKGVPGTIFLIGNMLSVIATAFAFITFCLFPALRNCPRGIATMNYMISLTLAKVAFQANPSFSGHTVTCSVVAMLQHYFCLAAFLWINVLAYDILIEAYHVRNGHVRNLFRRRGYRDLVLYSAFAFGIPLSIVCACLIVELLEGMTFQYGNQEQCGVLGDEALLYSLAIPLVVISILNMAFFIITVQMLRLASTFCGQSTRAPPPSTSNSSGDSSPRADGDTWVNIMLEDPAHAAITNATGHVYVEMSFREYLRPVWTYVRMAAICSMAWLCGFIAVFTQIYSLWFIYVMLNTVQGITIFVSLVLNAQVMKMFFERFGCIPERMAVKCGIKLRERACDVTGPFPCSIPAISDGYSLLDDNHKLVYLK